MPANTAQGWPYILPADHPLEYPAQSQQMANVLGARLGANKIWTGIGMTGATGLISVSFTGGTFTAPPMVYLTGQHPTYDQLCTVASVSATGVEGRALYWTGTAWVRCTQNFQINILAIGA